MSSELQCPSTHSVHTASDAGEYLPTHLLTRRLVAGDEDAYREFHQAYAFRLARYLLVLTRGDELAMREALQETFRRVVRHIRPFDQEPVFWSWLTVLARSAHSDARRKLRRYLSFLDRFRSYSETDYTPRASAPEQTLEPLLNQCLEQLPKEDQALLREKYLEERPVADLASELQTTPKAVESRLTRARQKLKLALLAALKNEPQP